MYTDPEDGPVSKTECGYYDGNFIVVTTILLY